MIGMSTLRPHAGAFRSGRAAVFVVTNIAKSADNARFPGQIGGMRFALFGKNQPDPSHIDVRYGDEAFKVMVRRRTAARRVTLRISNATGEVVMTLPEKASLTTAKRFADAHGGWIAARIRKLPDRIAFEAGASIPVRGIPHRIVRRIAPSMRTGIFGSPEGEAPVIVVAGEEPHIPRRVQELLKREARRDIEKAVARYTARLGVQARKITLRDTRSRWGSCSSRGGLSFSWRLILAPPHVLDYLTAHEAAHLVEMNHSVRFWRIVHDICPHTDEAERWLKRNGSGLHRYG